MEVVQFQGKNKLQDNNSNKNNQIININKQMMNKHVVFVDAMIKILTKNR